MTRLELSNVPEPYLGIKKLKFKTFPESRLCHVMNFIPGPFPDLRIHRAETIRIEHHSGCNVAPP